MVEKKSAAAAQATPKAAPAATKATRPAAKPRAAAKPAAAAKVLEESTQGVVEAGTVAVKTIETTVESMVEAGAEAAKEYEKAVTAAQEQVEKTSGALAKGYEDLAASGTETMDAYIKCSAVMARGVESLSKEVTNFAQASFEANLTATQRLMAAKTLREAMDLQADYTRDSFDSMVSEAAKLTEMSVDLASELMRPIQAQIDATTNCLFKPLAR